MKQKKEKTCLKLNFMTGRITHHKFIVIIDILVTSEPRNYFIQLDNERGTIFEFDDIPLADIENAIKSGNIKPDLNVKDDDYSESLLSFNKEKLKLLLVKLSGRHYVVNDKNNYRLITTLLTRKLQKCTVIERKCSIPATVDIAPRPMIELTPVDVSKHSRWISYTRADGHPVYTPNTNRKILSPTKLSKVCAVPPELPRQSPSPKDEFVQTSFPLTGNVYDNNVRHHSQYDNTKYSIQATDGACSMPSFDSFASNVEPRYKPTTSRSAAAPSTPPTAIGGSKRVPRPAARHPDLMDYDTRRDTFMRSDWEKHRNRPDISELLEWGFFYTGRLDLVRCYQCGIGLKDWSLEDVVRDEHIRHSSDCAFLKEKLGQDSLNQLKLQILYETDGGSFPGYSTATRYQNTVGSTANDARTPNSANPSYMATSKSSIGPTDTTQVKNSCFNKNAKPTLQYSVRHPRFQSVESRLATFTNYPSSAQQDTRRLAIAGFIYTGTGDTCRCFCCDGGMQYWNATDEPVREHAKYFPNCNYIRQIKGDEYIKSVKMQADRKDEKGNMPNQATQATDTSSPPTSKFAGLSVNKNQVGKPATQSTNHDMYRSTIVKNVLDSGQFSQTQANTAVDVLMKKGITDFTEDDIVNAILDDPGTCEQLGSNSSASDANEILQENERLKNFIKCLCCREEEANVLFLPCAHHKVCLNCSDGMEKCPVCSKYITQKVKTFMS